MIKSLVSAVAVGFIFSSGAVAFPYISKAKLYSSLDTKPSPYCDIHTQLTLLRMEGDSVSVHLEEKVIGICEIYIAPNPRDGVATLSDAPCGSKTLKGQFLRMGGLNGDEFEITDHRTRLCDDLPAGMVEMSVKNEIGPVQNLVGIFEDGLEQK